MVTVFHEIKEKVGAFAEMKSIVIEIKIVGEKLNRLTAAEERIGEMEDNPEEITHSATEKDKKVENMS